MADMNISPEELINNLSQQLGALLAENTALKMAIGKTQEALSLVERELASHTSATAQVQADAQAIAAEPVVENKKKKR